MREPPANGRPFDATAFLDEARHSPDLIAICERDGAIVDANRGVAGLERRALHGRRLADLATPLGAEAIRSALLELEQPRAARIDAAFAADGGITWYQLSFAPLAGGTSRIVVIGSEITRRRENEDRLQRAAALMTDAQGTAHLGTWEWDPALPHATWSDELYRIYGLTKESYTPSYEAYLTKVHPDDREHVIAATNHVFTTHEPYSHDERILRPDGSIRYLHTWAHAIVDPSGKLERLIGVCQDITDRKRIELELAERNDLLVREASERTRVETLLRRAQKLEAIGRLTGGIAHDFNNVLGVVMTCASIVHARTAPGSEDRQHLGEIMNAVERAARMTGQLLSFSSDRTIARGPLALDRVVSELAQLIRRLIGEEIELRLDLDDARHPRDQGGIVVNADASQLEQILMNLAVNARDAMPDGGILTIETARVTMGAGEDVPPGAYARLRVSDTGSGMTEEVQAHIFEPFFTTKELGRGTGLGLSTVYGIAKQSGGSIRVESEPGKGTRFDILLPITERAPGAAPPEDTLPAPRGGETILLVEDEAGLRSVLRSALEAYGYRVLEAGDAVGALALAADDAGPIDLLLTDVVMPKLSGRELAERLLEHRPELRVLYVSGYTSDVVLREGVIEGKVAMLRKPFTAEQLARRVRELLD